MRTFLTLFAITLGLSSPAIAAMEGHGGHHQKPSHAAMSHQGSGMQASAKTAADRDLLNVTHNMHRAMDVELIGTPDADFMRAMIPHHQGAIDMARVVLKHGKDERVRWLAGNIVKAQTWEIGWMKRLLARSNQPLTVKTGGGAMEKSADTDAKRDLLAIHQGMHRGMDVTLTGNPDADFVRAMIPHHQGAIDMAYWVRDHGRNTETRKLAREIIKAQTGEIAWMKNWLKTQKKSCGCVRRKAKH